jgi:hypothetical protein
MTPEIVFHSAPELDDSERVLGGELDDTSTDVALDHAERAAVQRAVRVIKVDMIQGIEELEAQLKTLLFRDIELTAQRDIDIEISWATQRIRSCIAKGSQNVRSERR